MADSTQERTERATERKLDEAVEKGQVAYSKDLTSALMLLGMLTALVILGPTMVEGLRTVFLKDFGLADFSLVSAEGLGSIVGFHADQFMVIALPLLIGVLIVVMLSGYLQVGFRVSFKRVELNWGRLNPAEGIKKLFSMRSVVSVLFSILKMTVVGLVTWNSIKAVFPVVSNLADADAVLLLHVVPDVIVAIGLRVAALILVLAIADVIWQRYRYGRDMMMTKEEVKEDRKRSEGDPRVKGRIRQMQKEHARARMIQDVKRATVVVRNPTHYAVAIRYEHLSDPSPIVLAKGRNLIAARIIEEANKAGVPIRTEPPLARELYRGVKVGQPVPEALFRAVAKVLAWVYRRRGLTSLA